MNFKEIDEARKLLELGDTATLQDIRNAYRRLALEHHPDRSKGKDKKEDAEMFKKITAAHDIIMAYCASYRYSFKKHDVEETADKEMDEQHLKNFYDGWITDFERSGDARKHRRRGEK